MNITTGLRNLRNNALVGGRPQEQNSLSEQAPRDTMTFTEWFRSDEPANPATVKKVGLGVGLAGIATTALGVATNNPGLVIGGMIGGMTGLTTAYAVHKAG